MRLGRQNIAHQHLEFYSTVVIWPQLTKSYGQASGGNSLPQLHKCENVVRKLFMKYLFQLLLLLVSICASAQLARVQILKQKNPITKEIYKFPKIIMANSPAVAQKINRQLREAVLFTTNINDNSIFDSVWRTKDQSPTLHDLSFAVSEITQSIISLSISAEGCGAYCEHFTNYFTFNANTGNRLSLDSFVNRQSLRIIVDSLNNYRSKRIDSLLKTISGSLTKSAIELDSAEKERFSEMQLLYKDCLERKIDVSEISDIGLLTNSGVLKIFTDRCSAHFNMALDELWTFQHNFVLKSCQNLLTPFALKIIEK